MASKLAKPHDEFFKAAFGFKEVALDYLERMLPPLVRAHLQLPSLERINGSFVSPALREHFSDVVYQCLLQDSAREVMVSFVFEHKSSPESRPHLQVLQYMLDLWEEQIKQKKDLTPIVPIIIYNGAENWHRKNLASYFGAPLPPGLLPFLPQFDYLFTPVTAMSDAEILALGEGLLVNAFLLLKHIHRPQFILDHPGLIFQHLAEPNSPRDFFISMFAYFLKSTEIDQIKMDQFIQSLPSALNQTAMTTYEKILEAGRQEVLPLLEAERQRAQQESLKAEAERQRAQQESLKAEAERQRAQQESLKAEAERQRADLEKQRVDQIVFHLYQTGQYSSAAIAELTQRDIAEIEALLKDLPPNLKL